MEKMDALQIEKLQNGILPETVKDKYTEAVVNQNIIAENGESIVYVSHNVKDSVLGSIAQVSSSARVFFRLYMLRSYFVPMTSLCDNITNIFIFFLLFEVYR